MCQPVSRFSKTLNRQSHLQSRYRHKSRMQTSSACTRLNEPQRVCSNVDAMMTLSKQAAMRLSADCNSGDDREST